ncbi:unnamed protein product [Macrosiphum euphorbiae]|uniref:Uncharacterized protein n=1 Tax=Macrosiphum euphorbiae TaxID=13131 RepID=A0AAV0XHT3_9HEMI|nr:unnamed protein product [Macrosiphum euphorbiae]
MSVISRDKKIPSQAHTTFKVKYGLLTCVRLYHNIIWVADGRWAADNVLTIKLHCVRTANCFGGGGDDVAEHGKKKTDYIRLVSAEIGAENMQEYRTSA